MSRQEELDRARLAREVLENPIYTEAFELVEKGIIQAWREARDKEDREHLHRMLLCLNKTRGVMQGVMASGKVTEETIRREQSKLQRIGTGLRSAFGG